jgi:Spy/CpxP family protein refolding chaperone
MLKRILVTALSAAFFTAMTAVTTVPLSPALAEMAKKKDEPKKEETKKEETKKELTPQQQKMKDCAAKWGDEKKTKNVKGRKAYNEFMSKCLKG